MTAPEPAAEDSRKNATGGVGNRLSRLERRLRLLLVHLTGPALRARIEIDDLVQEVYIRALGATSLPPNEQSDPGDAELWRYLIRLARNTVIDAARAIRAAKRSGPVLRLAHSDWSQAGVRASQILAATWGPATRAAAHELEERLEARFEALSAEHQRVIGLRQLEGLSAREVAQRLGRTETAVHSLYRRALEAWQGPDLFAESGDESRSE